MNTLAAYPYLSEACILLLLGLSTFWILPHHRKSLLLAILLLLPAAITARHHVPHYWDPVVVARFICSPADVIWTASCGIIAWFLAILPFHRRVTTPGRLLRPILLIAACYLSGGIIFELLHRTILPRPEDVMPASVLLMLLAAIFFAWRGPSEIPLGVAGGIGYCLFHIADVGLGFLAWPHSKEAWNPDAQLSWEFLGVPGWEIIWGACFGLAWPLVFAGVTGIRLLPAKKIPRRTHCLSASTTSIRATRIAGNTEARSAASTQAPPLPSIRPG